MLLILIILTLLLAFANGANDVSKGIAPLVGSGVTSLRRALTWGTAWTIAGALTAALFTQALVVTFSGKGLLASATSTPAFLLAVACGAIGWLLIATRSGMPVSTTHALVGALCGAGIASAGVHGVLWNAVAMKSALPLALSPLLSLTIVYALHPFARKSADACVCVVDTMECGSEAAAFSSSIESGGSAAAVHIASAQECAASPNVIASMQPANAAQWLLAAAISFFRGMNDTPKIVAVGIAAAAALGVASLPFYLLVALAMGAGSFIWGARVTDTLACKVTPLSPSDGLVANVVTLSLVAAASFYALPVSTTHVSSGSIIGAGLARRDGAIHWKMVSEMLMAWLVTLPVAALLGGIAFRFLA
jgi:PiT family inorganic phosphate transporter